jgi:hypothetical protein
MSSQSLYRSLCIYFNFPFAKKIKINYRYDNYAIMVRTQDILFMYLNFTLCGGLGGR